MKKRWRRLDNTAKVFSFAEKINSHVFRLSAILTEQVNPNILKDAIIQTLEKYPSFKVKKKTGLFWNYLEENKKEPIVEIEHETPCKSINLRRNNDYLFKVTYYKNKINLDIFHILTDGVGATILLKEILYNYLNIKYGLVTKNQSIKQDNEFRKDAYLENFDKTLKYNKTTKKAFEVPNKVDYSINKTYHYIVKLDEIKNIKSKSLK